MLYSSCNRANGQQSKDEPWCPAQSWGGARTRTTDRRQAPTAEHAQHTHPASGRSTEAEGNVRALLHSEAQRVTAPCFYTRGTHRSSISAVRSSLKFEERGTGQGGVTALGAVRLGGQHCHEIAGLAFEVCSSATARNIALYGTHMPKAQPMIPLQAFGVYEHVMINSDGQYNQQQVAWAMANWLKLAGSPRPIDTQRVSTLEIRNYTVLDGELPVASAITRRSKGRNRWCMKALEWRAVLIPIYHDKIDGERASHPRSQHGKHAERPLCLFRM